MKIKKIIYLILVIVIIVATYFVAQRYWNQAPARTTATFFNEIAVSGSLTKAYSLTDSAYHKNVSLKNFGISFSPIYKSNIKFTVQKFRNSGQYAIVNGSILNVHKHNYVYYVVLIKVAKNWLINNVYINPINNT